MSVSYKKKNDLYIWLTIILFLLGTVLFLVLSLWSYHAEDPCLLYVSTNPLPVHNIGGKLGAQASAFLYYYFGSAALLIPLLLLFVLYFVVNSFSFKKEWERLLGFIGFIFCSSLLCVMYKIDIPWIFCSGGMIGWLEYNYLAAVCDPLIMYVFLLVSMISCFVLMTRFCYIGAVKYFLRILYYCAYIVRRYKIINFLFYSFYLFFYYLCIWPLQFVLHFIMSLLNGSAFDETDFITPEYTELFSFDLSKDYDSDTVLDNDAIGDLVVGKSDDYIVSPMVENKKIIKSFYTLPSLDMFVCTKIVEHIFDVGEERSERSHILQDKLNRFGISGQVTAIRQGPVVTLFEYKPDLDTKLSKIICLEDDLAMALQAMSVRILAPIPGKAVVGFEVSNIHRHDVLFSQLVTHATYKNFVGFLPVILGKGTTGDIVIVDLARMPHLLIAGSTGSGKSVALNVILMSLLCKLSPDELKIILIDPKRLEFSAFTDIAHLLFPIITSAHQAAPVLRWVVNEMESRYEKMAMKGVRNSADYNKQIDENNNEQRLPSILIIIDELADLMLTVGRDIEDLITRITQMARAAGIHMIVATQRPSVDVITGLIKANFPSRISFRVASRIDSRTILDSIGADRLLGCGDMLFLDASGSGIKRIHGAYVSDREIISVVNSIRSQRKVEYLDIHEEMKGARTIREDANDSLYHDIKNFLDEVDEISISLIQRRFRIGYNRSARIIDALEADGLIMSQDGSKMRKVIR